MNKPGADGILGTADDEIVTLNDFTRQIAIAPLNIDGTATLNPNLRQVTVTIRYRVDRAWRTYRLVSYVSSVLIGRHDGDHATDFSLCGSQRSAGFSLIEVLISMGILTVVIGATLAGMANMMTANEIVLQTATMNNALRTGMDLIIRDLLQVGSGLPVGSHDHDPERRRVHRVNIPGPPGTAFQTAAGDTRFRLSFRDRARARRSTAFRPTSSRC